MAHGVNANVVRKWLPGMSMKRCGQHPTAPQSPTVIAPVPFLSVNLPVTCSDQDQVATDVVPTGIPATFPAFDKLKFCCNLKLSSHQN
jgi:hypothetical protein